MTAYPVPPGVIITGPPRPNGVPPTAKRHILKVNRKPVTEYWIWQWGKRWYWQALGNNGGSPSEEEAQSSARAYIRDGDQQLAIQNRNTQGES